MDELYAFLFAGLAIIFLLFAFFGGPQVTLNNGGGGDKDFESGNLTWKEISLGDIISKETEVKATRPLETSFFVQNGFFFGSTEYERRVELDKKLADNLNYASLRFGVSKTNNYGSLEFIMNNRTLYSENPIPGDYSINLSQMDPVSVIYVRTTSSAWRVWAPARYEISNMKLDLSYNTKENPSYEFDVPHYVYDSYYKGELKFNSIYPADLVVYLNGAEIYSKAASGQTTITLGRNAITPEANIIEFDSLNDYRLENAKIYLYYRG